MKIQSIQPQMATSMVLKKQNTEKTQQTENKGEIFMQSLTSMANINRVSFLGKNEDKFEIGMSEEELKMRTGDDYLCTKKMLDVDSPEYENLEEGDKKALKHLVKAAYIIEDVYLKQDNAKNIEFKKFLEKGTAKGDEKAKMALKLFTAQKGINAIDCEANRINLMKGEGDLEGKGLYPADITKEEFQEILIEMLEKGKVAKVRNILNQRSVVRRDGDELKSTDYTIEFKKEFKEIAEELKKAAKVSTNKDFNQYLLMQAEALTQNDPMLDAKADKKWATLQDTPLEFTITRENYEDELMGCVVENKKLNKLLKNNGINPTSKDMLGIRVGIVNKEGTEDILKVKQYLPAMAENMPYKDKYVQNISSDSKKESKQTMVDVDLVAVTGDVGGFRGGITLAENLPNNDKKSLTIGGGRRNVYHRQIRKGSDPVKVQNKLDAVLDPSFHKYYDIDAKHKFTVGHENGHSLGPKEGTEALGKNKNIIEENKADMVSIGMLDVLTEAGLYTEKEKKQIMTTFVTDTFLKAKPDMTKAHRVRSAMQANFFLKEGAVSVDEKGILKIDLEKVVPTAQKMLAQIVDVQMSQNFEKGEKFVNDNFKWTDEMEQVAQKLREVDKILNGQVSSPLADRLAAED